MESIGNFPIIFIVIITILSANLTATTAQPPDFFLYGCTYSANYTTNSTYQTNLNTLLSSLPSTSATNYGFSHTSNGVDPDRVYAIALCRGDISNEICQSCVSNLTQKLIDLCPKQKEAIGWYDLCMLKYSGKNIFYKNDDLLFATAWNTANVTSVTEFNSALRILTDRLRSQAAGGGSLRKYAAGNVTGPDFLTIYCLVQCTPDLTDSDCGQCLEGITRRIPSCCYGKQGGRILVPSCSLRFEVYPFYNDTLGLDLALFWPSPPPAPPPSVPQLPPPLPTSPPSPPPDGKPRRNMRTVIVITVTVGFVTMAICAYLYWKCVAPTIARTVKSGLLFHERAQASSEYKPHPKIEELPLLTFEELANATEGFHSSYKLGQGGFGPVYKGKLSDGQEIAVKRLSRSSGQGLEEFMNEVVLISKLQHRNLVRLLGCCVENEEKMLIYEYMPNRSLDAHLFDPYENEHLLWSTRKQIVEGICRGLLYLHRDSRLKIIHRDLKASNVLLDDMLNPKISDFGMARIVGGNQIHANTARVVGTYGYMAPEYAMEGRFSEKSDVYSFGVLLLEIVSGRRNNSFYNNEVALSLLAFAWHLWNGERIIELLDPSIAETCSQLEIIRYIQVGLLCVQESAKDRPSISTVLSILSSEIANLPTPNKPAFTGTSISAGSHSQQKQKFSENNVTLSIIEGR